MECDRILLNSVNSTLRYNMGKVVFALLLVLLLSSFIVPAVLAVVVLPGSIVLGVVGLFFAVALFFVLMYGFVVLLLKLYRKEPAVLGHVFAGFWNFKRVFPAAAVFSVALVIIAFVVAGCGLTLYFQFVDVPTGSLEIMLTSVMPVIPILTAVFALLFLLGIVLQGIFIFFTINDYPEYSFRVAVAKAFALRRGKTFRLLGFLLRTGGIWLIAAVISFVIVSVGSVVITPRLVASMQDTAAVLLALMQICNAVQFVGTYMTLIRMITGTAAFYNALQNSPETDQPQLSAAEPHQSMLPPPDES